MKFNALRDTIFLIVILLIGAKVFTLKLTIIRKTIIFLLLLLIARFFTLTANLLVGDFALLSNPTKAQSADMTNVVQILIAGLIPYVLFLATLIIVAYKLAYPHSKKTKLDDFEKCRLAAEHGDAQAQTKLGGMYALGNGVTQDNNEAYKWFLLAAKQGYAKAQYNVGVMNIEGHSVPQDQVKAYVWFSLAAAKGHEQARIECDSLAEKMTPEQIAKSNEITRDCEQSNYEKYECVS